jgi:hypothetical protein
MTTPANHRTLREVRWFASIDTTIETPTHVFSKYQSEFSSASDIKILTISDFLRLVFAAKIDNFVCKDSGRSTVKRITASFCVGISFIFCIVVLIVLVGASFGVYNSTVLLGTKSLSLIFCSFPKTNSLTMDSSSGFLVLFMIQK